MKGLLISTAIIVLVCKLALGLGWSDTFYAWLVIGILVFVIRTALDCFSRIGQALSGKRGDTINFNQHVHEEHKHGDPTRPGEEIYPAVVEIRRELGK